MSANDSLADGCPSRPRVQPPTARQRRPSLPQSRPAGAAHPTTCARVGWVSMLLLESQRNAVQPPSSRTHGSQSEWAAESLSLMCTTGTEAARAVASSCATFPGSSGKASSSGEVCPVTCREPGGSACCHWNGYGTSATTRLKDDAPGRHRLCSPSAGRSPSVRCRLGANCPPPPPPPVRTPSASAPADLPGRERG